MKYRKKPVVVEAYQTDKELNIETLEGTMHASAGDYIITGVNGEQYPCKPDIFDRTYEMVEWDEALAKAIIESVPTIDPVKHGKWIAHPTEEDWDVCSVCGVGTMRRTHGYGSGGFWDAEESYSFCPWCGARMDGE